MAVRNRIRPRLVKAGVGLVVLIVVAFGISGTDLAEVEVGALEDRQVSPEEAAQAAIVADRRK